MGLAASRQEAFWEACGFGHVNRVKKFLSEGVDVNWKSYTHDCCAIHVASQGKPEIVQMLLEAECDVNVRDDRGNLALHHAAMKGHADIMQTLIDAGSQINAQDKNGWTSLHCSAYWAHPRAVQVLVNAGIDIHLQNKDERTALHETARSKEKLEEELGEISRMLTKAGCDVNAKSSDEGEADFTPLMFAAYHGHPEVAMSLIEAGCDMNARGTNLWTALHWAADRENEEVVYMLLEAGADPTCTGLRDELAADRANSNPDLKEMLMNAVNMFKELSSIGGSNPSSQISSPITDSPKSPLVELESTDLEVPEEAETESHTIENIQVTSYTQSENLECTNHGNINVENQVSSTAESLTETFTENMQLAEKEKLTSVLLVEEKQLRKESTLAEDERLQNSVLTEKGDAEISADISRASKFGCDALNAECEVQLDENLEQSESLNLSKTINQ